MERTLHKRTEGPEEKVDQEDALSYRDRYRDTQIALFMLLGKLFWCLLKRTSWRLSNEREMLFKKIAGSQMKPDVLIWFFQTFKWIQDFDQKDWKEFSSRYHAKCKLCNLDYHLGEEVWWKKDVGCLHPECFDQLVELGSTF